MSTVLPQSSPIYAHTSFASIQPTNDDRVDLAQRFNIPAPLPSALAAARIIYDLGSISYPEGIKTPSAELNIGAKDGKFRYDREFLLQFMSIRKEKPDMLPPLESLGLEPYDPRLPWCQGRGIRKSHNASAPHRQTTVRGFPPASLEPVSPLQATAPDSPEFVDRKVTGLLNQLTMENFGSISDEIITWVNKSEDGPVLSQVVHLVVESAAKEAAGSEMYARLCRKMMEQISNRVQDDGIKRQGGAPLTGGHLFRKYLLNRCRENFERGWVAKEIIAAGKACHDESINYAAVQKAQRQGLGFIKFIGELFKLQMLTERIMHEYVKKLLENVDNPEEEEIESLCTLLTTVGEMLDTKKARAHMDVYFSRVKELSKSGVVSSGMQFMLQDVIELRERHWVPRHPVEVPMTITQICETASIKDDK